MSHMSPHNLNPKTTTIIKAPAASSVSSSFVRQHSNCLFTHGARGRLEVPAGFRAVTVKCDLLCFSGTRFFSPLVARLLCHDSVGRLFMRVSNCVCGCRWCQSGCPVHTLPPHPRRRESAAPFVAVIVPPGDHTPAARLHRIG